VAEAYGMLSEHEAAPKDDKPKETASYSPTPEERKAIQKVEKLLGKAKKHRAMYDKKWLEYYRMFRGRQWKEGRPSYRHSEVINLVFRTIQSLVPIQVDARPRFEFLPQEPADQEIGEILDTVAEADWIKRGWSEQLLEVIYDANIYGTGLSAVEGEPNRIDYKSMDPVYCYPDPEARDVNKEASFFVTAEPRDVHVIKRRYPELAKYLKADIESLMKSEKTSEETMFRSPADRNMVMEGSSPPDPANKDMALLKTLYLSPGACEDETEEEEREVKDAAGNPVIGPDGMPTVEWVQVAKYPHGRKIVTCNGVLLEDGPLPYDDQEFPFQRYPNYVLPREFWGMSEVEQLAGPQRIFNKMVSFALDVMTLMGNPIWMIPTTSGVDADNLVNRPGLNVEYDPTPTGDVPTRIEGVGLQPFVLQLIDRMGEWFDSIAGSQDITRGVQPTGVTANSAINTLQEAAHTRIRQKSRNLDAYLQQVGQQYKSRVFQFYSAPQIVRLTGNEGAARYFRMHIEATPEGKRTMKVTPFTDRGLEDPTEARQFEIQGDFDVRVVTGSSLPFAKAELESKMLNLFDRQIVDAEEVLKRTDYPNYQAVLQRVQAQAQAAAEAQMMAGAPGGAPAA
jgi:hypothetical protein